MKYIHIKYYKHKYEVNKQLLNSGHQCSAHEKVSVKLFEFLLSTLQSHLLKNFLKTDLFRGLGRLV